MESHELSDISNLMAFDFQILTPSFRWRKSAPRTRTNIPISLRQQSLGRRRSETSCGICSHEPSAQKGRPDEPKIQEQGGDEACGRGGT